MLLLKDHAEVLLKVEELGAREKAREIAEETETITEIIPQRLLELELQGLMERVGPNEWELTDAGKTAARAVAEVVDILGLPPQEWTHDRWVGSDTVLALKHATLSFVPEHWGELLQERGLSEDGELTKAGELVLEAYFKATPKLYVTQDVAGRIARLPPGPGTLKTFIKYREMVGISDNILHALEAMRLLVLSPPTDGGRTYSLTALGREVKYAIEKAIPAMHLVLSPGIMEDVKAVSEGEEPEDMERLERLGYAWKGSLTRAGEHVLRAYEILGEDLLGVPPISVRPSELRLLEIIDNLHQPEENPNVAPTLKRIKRVLVEEYGETDPDPVTDLKELEAHGFVKKTVCDYGQEKGKPIWVLTEEGERLLHGLGTSVRAEGVKAITVSMGFESPSAEWLEEAHRAGLVSQAAITSKGLMTAKIARHVRRSPFLTGDEAKLIYRMPHGSIGKWELVEDVCDRYGFEEHQILESLSKLESRGVVEELLTGGLILTRAGQHLKKAIHRGQTMEILKLRHPITPVATRFLKTIRDMKREGVSSKRLSKFPKTLLNRADVTLNQAKKAVVLLRRTKMMSGWKITEAGEELLKAFEVLREAQEVRRHPKEAA
ncbi:DUF505 domain-containing protein [Methanopyrus sp.]